MAPVRVTRQQALAWRLRRQHLLTGAGSAPEVVRTLAAVSVNGSDPDLAVRRRLGAPGAPGEVRRALADGRLLRTFSFRGSVQLMAPETAGTYLALRAAGRQWELRSWVEHYRLPAEAWPALREIVRGVVADGPVPPRAVADEVAGHPRFSHLAAELAEPNITLVKPLCWQGDVVLGPDLGAPLVLQSPEALQGWAGIPPLEEAGPRAVRDYVAAYGPTTPDHLHHWLGEGLSAGRARVERWWRDADACLAEVDVEGEPRWVLAEELDDLVRTRAGRSLVLLPGKDAWVMGPGTKDTWVVPAEHRTSMTRGAAPVVVDGVVRGTWRLVRGCVELDCADASHDEVAVEVERLEGLLRTP